jgi:hypothetical protein
LEISGITSGDFMSALTSRLNLTKEKIMKLVEVRSVAKSHNIKPGHLSKSELIRAVQREEGNFACFATAYHGECDQAGCLWREDCFAAAREGALS